MGYGLRVTNSSGAVQIDVTYRNHVLIESGTASVPQINANNEGTLDVTLATPIALTRGPLIWGLPSSTGISSAVTGLRVNGSAELTGFQLATEYGSGSVDVDWRVTALPTSASGAAWGLNVYDAAGALAFDGGASYLRISDVSSAVTISSGAGDTTYTHTSAATRFACLSALSALGQQQVGDFIQLMVFGARRISDTQTRMHWFSFGENYAVFPVTTYQPGTRQLVIAT